MSIEGNANPQKENERRVLIVDDEKDFLVSLEDILESRGYRVEKAHSQKAACEKIDGFDAHVALLDIRLGGADGINLIGKLGKAQPGIICVMMTAYAVIETAISALQKGAYDYLRKPFEARDLLATLDRCFEKIRLENEKALAEKALRESEERHRLFFENAPIGIIHYSKKGIITAVNEAMVNIFKSSKEKLIGLNIDSIPNKIFSKEVYKSLGGKLGHFEGEYTSYTGKKTSYIKTNWIPIKQDREILSGVGIVEDITRVKELEQEQIQAEMKFHQSQKMEAVGRLAGGVAHDFNNMLGVIIGHAELAMEQKVSSLPVHDDLKEIYNAARRSADLTQQLLSFARKQVISPMVLDLNDAIMGMLKMLRRLIGEDIDLAWTLGTNLWPIKIDPAQVDQILANLCVNARDAINGTGKLTIETKNIVMDQASCAKFEGLVPGEYVMMLISDDGCGMDMDTLDNLFEPFFTTKDVGEGTGLGLSMVYGIVKQNDGCIYVSSKPGEGTTFNIYFHRALVVADSKGKSVDRVINKGTETVLLVEDEPSFLRLGKTVLERLGYLVLSASTPSEALTLAEQQNRPIDLLITDMVMPEMNGKDLKNRIKKLRPDIKVLFMSGYTPNAIVQRGILEDDIDFLPKPFSVNSLASKVRKVLDQQE